MSSNTSFLYLPENQLSSILWLLFLFFFLSKSITFFIWLWWVKYAFSEGEARCPTVSAQNISFHNWILASSGLNVLLIISSKWGQIQQEWCMPLILSTYQYSQPRKAFSEGICGFDLLTLVTTRWEILLLSHYTKDETHY